MIKPVASPEFLATANEDVHEFLTDIQHFMDELHDQSTNPPYGDALQAQYAKSLLNLCKHDNSVFMGVAAIINERKNVVAQNRESPSSIVNMFMIALRYHYFDTSSYIGEELLNAKHLKYHAKAWEDIFYNTGSLIKFSQNVINGHAKSVAIERYAATKLALSAINSIMGHPLVVADVGCSSNIGMLKVLLNEPPFHQIEIEDNEIASHELQLRLNKPIDLEYVLGIDKDDPSSAKMKNFIMANSFKWFEMSNTARISEYEWLHHPELSSEQKELTKKIGMVALDVLDYNGEQFSRDAASPADTESSLRIFDVINLSTMLYQLSEEQRFKALENLKKFIKVSNSKANNSGYLLVQDFARPDSQSTSGLHFFEHWFDEPYKYRTLLLNMADPEAGFKELFRWEDARCKRAQLGDAFSGLTEHWSLA